MRAFTTYSSRLRSNNSIQLRLFFVLILPCLGCLWQIFADREKENYGRSFAQEYAAGAHQGRPDPGAQVI